MRLKDVKETIVLIDTARELVESKGENCPVFTSYDKKQYRFTGKQMQVIAQALYRADITTNETLKEIE